MVVGEARTTDPLSAGSTLRERNRLLLDIGAERLLEFKLGGTKRQNNSRRVSKSYLLSTGIAPHMGVVT